MKFEVKKYPVVEVWGVFDLRNARRTVLVAEFGKECDALELCGLLNYGSEDEIDRVIRTVALFRASGYTS